MEGKIRDYINETYHPLDPFVEGKHEEEGEVIGFREHTDGENTDTILEIKTTGGNVDRDVYVAQVVWYMHRTNKKNGLLAVYLRPEDMSTDFEVSRLSLYKVRIEETNTVSVLSDCGVEIKCVEGFLDKISNEVKRFIADLKELKADPFLTEQDFIPQELVEVSDRVLAFEERMKALKAEEKRIKDEKKKLYEKMLEANVKTWVTPSGYRITRVDEIPESEKEVDDFDSELFEKENPELAKKYTSKKIVKVSGRAGYVLATAPKEGKKK